MSVSTLLGALRHGWWLVAISLVVGVGSAAAYSLVQTPMYPSGAQLFVSTRDVATTYDAFTGSQFSRERISSYTRLITGDEIAERVIDRLDLDVTASALSRRISAVAVADTVLIDVSVIDPSPRQAQRVAEAVSAEFIDYVAELEAPDGEGPSPVRVVVTKSPQVADAPSQPQTRRNLALGLLLGVVFGCALAVVRVRMDRSVRSTEEARRAAGVPVIGAVLRDDALERHHTIDLSTGSRAAEDYRQLRANLQFLSVDDPPKVIMISSALPSEGKTTIAVNLALALAGAGRRVTVVEADLRKPKVTRYLGLVGGVGLTNVLSGSADVEEVLQKHGEGDLYVLAAGPTPPNPGELLSSSHMFSLLDKLRAENDFVLVDAPPLLPVADSTGLSVYMDGVLLSVRYGHTRTDQLEQAASTLERVGAKVLGVILNIVPPRAELASAYGYGYSYGYEADRKPPGGAEADRKPPGGAEAGR